MSTDVAVISTDLALIGTVEEIAKLPADQQPMYITAALAESRKWLSLATESQISELIEDLNRAAS